MRLRSYAKINLSLDILGVREDGYHEVATVMQQTSLSDIIKIEWHEDESRDFVIRVKTNRPYIPNDERNLAYRAALLMRSEAEKKHHAMGMIGGTLDIDIEKRIPVAAGLAGGSGNAAAVMIGLNRIWGFAYDTKTLCDIGSVLGADVPFCILIQNSGYRCALGTGTGEKLRPLNSGIKKHIVLAKPAFGVSTKEVYREIDKVDIPKRPDTDELISAIKTHDYDKLYDHMVNVLEYYTLAAYPQVSKLKSIMIDEGHAEKVMMSGSGPTVMGLYGTKKEAMAACMLIRGKGYEAYWADTYRDF